MSTWALALSPPNAENRVAAALTRYQFPNVLFQIRTRVVHRGYLRDHLRPAFPRYIFCKPNGLFHTIRTRISGIEFVREGQGNVATVPDAAITSLIEAADAEHVLPTPEIASAKFKTGDRIIIRGASMLAGYAALYQHAIDELRAVVLINWLGRMCPCAIDERDLIAEPTTIKTEPRRKRRRRRHKGHRKLDSLA